MEWIAEQVMNLLDMINGSVLGALGCNMNTFTRYFPAAETMHGIFVGLKLTFRTILFMGLVFFSQDIVNHRRDAL